jgi:lipopolysaccharide exporter
MAMGRRVAAGAVWMVALKLIERGIGVVSTLILARLLVPADFGLVAMAMAVFAFVELAGSFGFDIALIRNHEATRAHYDSAWTLSVGYGVLSGLLLTALAWPTAVYFGEPRLLLVMQALAAISLIQGLENIGAVNFRKHFQFGKDFQLMLAKKLIAFCVTLALAFSLRSYWALLGGIAASRVSGVAMSFVLHPYRPRFNTTEIRGLFQFSRWIVLSRVIEYFNDRGPDLLIGRALDAASLGMFRVAKELATLPTTELLFPIMRAVFPGYAAVAHDRAALARSFLAVQGMILTLTVPAAAAIVMLADPIVRLLLGPNWLPAIPLIQVLGLYGALTAFQATNIAVFNVLGVPHWATSLKAAEATILLPLLIYTLGEGLGLQPVAWCIFLTQALLIPAGMILLARTLKIGLRDRMRVVWRPLLATMLMVVAIHIVLRATGHAVDLADAARQLLIALPVAALCFIGAIIGLWRIAGKPEGAEQRLAAIFRERFGRP